MARFHTSSCLDGGAESIGRADCTDTGACSHGSTWRIGSDKIQPRHTTECSVAQSFDGTGDVFIYTRIWAKNAGYGRGIARSTDVRLSYSSCLLWQPDGIVVSCSVMEFLAVYNQLVQP